MPTPALSVEASIEAIFRHSRTVAVVGLSPKPERESHGVAAAMQAAGWRIVPINPNAAGSSILGEVCYPNLEEAILQVPDIALVNVFRRSEEVMEIAYDAIAIGTKGLWLQQGIREDEAVAMAQAAGLWAVQDRCIKIAWRSWSQANPGI